MNRTEFMKRLCELLSDISESEREEALKFYEGYFDDAGIENEQNVIAALGTPEKVAEMIKEGLNDSNGEQGEFSENGFGGYGSNVKDEVGYHGKVKLSDRMKGLGTGGLVLLLILAVFALPILGPVIMGIVSVIFGILAAAAAVLFALVIVGIALLVAGASVFAAAIGCLFVTPAMGLMLFGISFLLIGFGILATVLGIWIVTKIVPPVIRFIVGSIQKILKKREV